MACVRLPQQDILELARRPLFVEDLYDDPLVMIAVPEVENFGEYQALTDRAIAPKSLTRFPMILPEPDSGLRRDFDRRCRDCGIADRMKVVVEIGPCQSAMAYVRDGVGVGVLPRSVAARASGVVVKALPPKLSPPNAIRVLCRKRAGTDDLDLSEGASEFLQLLRDVSARLAKENGE
jgi:DNA-binding transcriptional LysR family regulator